MESVYSFCETEEFLLMKRNIITDRIDTKGLALVMVLAIVTVSASLIAVAMYFALTGSEMSALQRKYESSKEASLGAIDIAVKEIIPRAISGETLTGVVGTFQSVATVVSGITPRSGGNTCFTSKLSTVTGSWSSCPSESDSQRMNPTTNPDITFNLKSIAGGRNFVVDMKIIDTIDGNSDTSGLSLSTGGVVDTGSGAFSGKHYPYLYTIATEGKLQNSTTEKANLEVLYAY
jgi:hypothetical protein